MFLALEHWRKKEVCYFIRCDLENWISFKDVRRQSWMKILRSYTIEFNITFTALQSDPHAIICVCVCVCVYVLTEMCKTICRTAFIWAIDSKNHSEYTKLNVVLSNLRDTHRKCETHSIHTYLSVLFEHFWTVIKLMNFEFNALHRQVTGVNETNRVNTWFVENVANCFLLLLFLFLTILQWYSNNR